MYRPAPDVLLDTDSKHGALADHTEWELCCIDSWDAAVLGEQPETFEELEESIDPHHFHLTIRTLEAGAHEEKAIRRAAARSKHILPLLAVARIAARAEDTPIAHAVDDPWGPDPWAVAEEVEARRNRDYDLFANTPKFVDPLPPLPDQLGPDSARHQWLSPRASTPSPVPANKSDVDVVVPAARQAADEFCPEGMGQGRLGAPIPRSRLRRSKMRNAATDLLRALWRDVTSKSNLVAAATKPAQDDVGATHMVLVQQRGTPLFGSEMEDPELAQQVFNSLRDVHRTLVHGDINPSNLVWDPTGHFFQFVDLEFSTWPAKVVLAPVTTPPQALDDDDDGDDGATPAAAKPLQASEYDAASPQFASPRTSNTGSYSHAAPSPSPLSPYASPVLNPIGGSGFAGTPRKPKRFSQRWSPDDHKAPPSPARTSPSPHFQTPAAPSPRDPFPGVPGPASTGGSTTPSRRTTSAHVRPLALDIPPSPSTAQRSGRLSTRGAGAGGGDTPRAAGAETSMSGFLTGRSVAGESVTGLLAMEEAGSAGYATGALARVVSADLVAWPLLPGAHGSTQAARLAPHGTLEYASINQLKGCWPTAADDTIGLFWTLVRSHCPRSLWWGGMPIKALTEDSASGATLALPLQEEANLLAYCQVMYLTTDSPIVTLKRKRRGVSPAARPWFSASATVPFVPPHADARTRWKHYLFRAFAGRHVLALTAAAGTPAEHATLQRFHVAMQGLLARVCRRGGLGGAPVPLSEEDSLLIHQIEQSMIAEQEPISYAAFLDKMDVAERGHARQQAIRAAQAAAQLNGQRTPPPPPPLLQTLEEAAVASGSVCFHGMDELHTSRGEVVWLQEESAAAVRAHYALAMPPWRLGAGLAPLQLPLPSAPAEGGIGVGHEGGYMVDPGDAEGEEAPGDGEEDFEGRMEGEAARWCLEGQWRLEKAARALRAAVAPLTAVEADGQPQNTWDASVMWLRGHRACALEIRRDAAAALTALVLLNAEAMLAIVGTLLAAALQAARAVDDEVAAWQDACDAAVCDA